MEIRIAQEEDIPYLLDIYNYEVLHGEATFDINPRTLSERLDWYYAHNISNHPLIVAVEDGHAVGYASLSPYRVKEAYAATVELSVYVHRDYRKRGIARKLTLHILNMAREDERIHTVISVITGGNQASIHLHEELGFLHCGTIKEVGVKFGRYLDIENYQMMV